MEEGEQGPFLMFSLVYIPNLGLLMSLESLEKFLCGGGGGGGGV